MRSDVLGFGVIRRARVLRRVQIARRHREPVGRAGVRVATVVVGVRIENAGKRVDAGA